MYAYTKGLTKELIEDFFKESSQKYRYIVIDWYYFRKYQGSDTWLYQFIDTHWQNIQEIPLKGMRNCRLLKVSNL